MMKLFAALLVILPWLLQGTAIAGDYLQEIKPLLEQKCYACHGALKQQSGLRLDTGASLRMGGDSGPLVTPGDPDQSYLMDVLTGRAGFRMPPESEGAPLTASELELVRQWIRDGATSPADEAPQSDPASWWSYQPITRPPLPDVQQSGWCRSPIDFFVAARREAAGLPHARPAERAVWLRRVYLDLIGLLPSRAELHAFLNDDSEQAYERVVDDLLNRPQYGERWGRHWMDVWRYSDWYGSRGINEIRYSQRHIWRWRDWIIRSLNADEGYDQMLRQMIAADELSEGDLQHLPATGYLGRNWYKFDRDVWLFETVERAGEAFLGLTFRCCRCHDHKFDPVSQEEYFRFRAFFEPHDVRTDLLSAETPMQKDATLGEVPTDGIALVYDAKPEVPTYRYERGDSRSPDKSQQLAPGVPAALQGPPLDVIPVDLPAELWYPMLRPELQAGLREKSDHEVLLAAQKLEAAKASAALSAAAVAQAAGREPQAADETVFLQDDFSSPRENVWKVINGQWVYENGRLVQKAVAEFATLVTQQDHPSDFRATLRYRTLSPGTYRSVGFSFDYQDQGNSQDIYTSAGDERQTVQAFHRVGGMQVYPPEGIVDISLKPDAITTLDVHVQGTHLTIDLNGQRQLEYKLPVPRRDGKFALWVHQGSAEFLELAIRAMPESTETLQRRAQQAEQAATLAAAELEAARAERDSLAARLDAATALYVKRDAKRGQALAQKASAAERMATVRQAEVALLKLEQQPAPDADALEKARQSVAGAQQSLQAESTDFTPVGPQYPRTSTGRRAALAEWLASPANPRTARVAANYLWGRHFGAPLVATPENFGLNGRTPTHPDLLDWLAAELIHHQWQMKPLHRQIVLSSTYRMASSLPAAAEAHSDQEDRLLARLPQRRMEAEVLRDSVLHLAGRLDLRFGGPEIPETDGQQVLRRSLYFRNTPNEKMLLLEVFDVADPNACYRRKESVIPHQSLALMNSGLIMDHARLIAEGLQAQSTDEAFVRAAFETTLTRQPSRAELDRCRAFLEQQSAGPPSGASDESFSEGGSARSAPADDPRRRARENLIHVLLMHNDFVTVR